MSEAFEEERNSLRNTSKSVEEEEERQPLKRECSFISFNSSSSNVCRICHCEGDNQLPLISPCACSGSLKFVHQDCLQQWIKSGNMKSCELCKELFKMTATVKPFHKVVVLERWQKLEMTKVESRKIMCSVTFHLIAITCVVWSLYVLIERTMEEVKGGRLEWPFWTKLIVVGIGFTGGFVFMYIQCKMYWQLCSRWRAYNRVIYVQNCPNHLKSSANSTHSSRHVVVEFDENDKVLNFPSSRKHSGGGDGDAGGFVVDKKGASIAVITDQRISENNLDFVLNNKSNDDAKINVNNVDSCNTNAVVNGINGFEVGVVNGVESQREKGELLDRNNKISVDQLSSDNHCIVNSTPSINENIIDISIGNITIINESGDISKDDILKSDNNTNDSFTTCPSNQKNNTVATTCIANTINNINDNPETSIVCDDETLLPV